MPCRLFSAGLAWSESSAQSADRQQQTTSLLPLRHLFLPSSSNPDTEPQVSDQKLPWFPEMINLVSCLLILVLQGQILILDSFRSFLHKNFCTSLTKTNVFDVHSEYISSTSARKCYKFDRLKIQMYLKLKEKHFLNSIDWLSVQSVKDLGFCLKL